MKSWRLRTRTSAPTCRPIASSTAPCIAGDRQLWLAHAEVEEVGHDLGVLQVWAGAHRFVIRSRLFDALQQKAGFDQQVQPLAEGAREPRNLELPKTLLDVRRRALKKPF